MYGYVVPQKSTLRASDFVLYRAFYCGLCCELGRSYGQLPRFTTNYDFTFLSALLHDYSSADVLIEEHKCVLNPVRKKATLMPDPLLSRLAAANIMLAYQKADDGVRDGDGLKYRAVRRMLKKPCDKARRACPEIWATVERGYATQTAVEKSRTKGIDRAADPFACLLRDLAESILGAQTDDNFRALCYNIGKFVYIVDALDDIADDSKKGRYNPFIETYGGFCGRKEFIAAHRDELEFIFSSICGRAEQCFCALHLTQSGSLLRNIVFDGMRAKVAELLDSEGKLKPPRI